jgi:hypothetical protein
MYIKNQTIIEKTIKVFIKKKMYVKHTHIKKKVQKTLTQNHKKYRIILE